METVKRIAISRLSESPNVVLVATECEMFQGKPVSGDVLAGICILDGDGEGMPCWVTIEFHYGRKAWHLKIEHSIQKALKWRINTLPEVIRQFEQEVGVTLPPIKIIDVGVGVYAAQSKYLSNNPWAFKNGNFYTVDDPKKGRQTIVADVRNGRTLICFYDAKTDAFSEGFEPTVVLSAAEWKSLKSLEESV